MNREHYIITSPNGREYIVVEGMNKFCTDISKQLGYKLHPGAFSNVLAGRQKHHKQWLVKYLTVPLQDN